MDPRQGNPFFWPRSFAFKVEPSGFLVVFHLFPFGCSPFTLSTCTSPQVPTRLPTLCLCLCVGEPFFSPPCSLHAPNPGYRPCLSLEFLYRIDFSTPPGVVAFFLPVLNHPGGGVIWENPPTPFSFFFFALFSVPSSGFFGLSDFARQEHIFSPITSGL